MSDTDRYRFKMWESTASGNWYWQLVALGGDVLAQSGKGLPRRIECIRSIELVRSMAPASLVEEILDPEANAHGS